MIIGSCENIFVCPKMRLLVLDWKLYPLILYIQVWRSDGFSFTLDTAELDGNFFSTSDIASISPTLLAIKIVVTSN